MALSFIPGRKLLTGNRQVLPGVMQTLFGGLPAAKSENKPGHCLTLYIAHPVVISLGIKSRAVLATNGYQSSCVYGASGSPSRSH